MQEETQNNISAEVVVDTPTTEVTGTELTTEAIEITPSIEVAHLEPTVVTEAAPETPAAL